MTTPVMFQALPPLSPEEYADLEKSILENGVLVPIVLDENGVVIDGHHRQQIAAHHDLPCPSETKRGFTDTEKRGLALSLNLHRRQLTREQKRALVAESIKADPQLSDREHGRRTGVADTTAGRVRRELEESAAIPHFSERLDPRTGNASQSATRPPRQDVEAPPEGVSPPAPRRRRRPIDESFFDATRHLHRAVTSLQNLGNDDRLPRNKNQLARYRRDVILAIEALQHVAQQMSPAPERRDAP
ncbi:ParB/RepB/Spo0J family partition protein [Gordonia hongkongensis]|uniref:ParB/RepB/Spo0J family partition protein n=1 Tax=Gordonia hongkongensis TaxID=1701090 RepID=UPI0030CF9202